ncbi:MAG: hypothetical protein GWN93_06830 [Deltaproteobacteria bacterium]|nr:hypothetical protein [Deltaproteobacteria bacterium]
MEIDRGLLKQFISWVASGGGALVISYAAMEFLGKRWPNLTSEIKRYMYMSLILASGIAMFGYYLLVLAAYVPAPESTMAWIEILFSVAWLAVTGSQAVHGRRKLKRAA